ncbi:MAG: NAD(P)-dependent glycerol-3-phosphate dehydrogenase [Candidatus Omnitrophica bacterium]|nr:NAD(P)-dependent glycerol-3-phosphate dehydrogenase [Candidatus Omnitrophota bacterium]
MTLKKYSIGVIGDGAWGTTLAILLAEKGYPVTVWGAFPDYLHQVSETRENVKFLPGIKIPQTICFSSELEHVLAAVDIVVLAVPSQFLSGVLRGIKKCQFKGKPFVSVVKGIDPETLMTMSQVIKHELGNIPVAVLSGPTIAIEVAKKIPTTAVVACKDPVLARELQQIFSCSHFRIYTNDDVRGVELCGSVKNVIALACGICDGLGFGTNTKAAILTRGLVEMTRLGKVLRARPETFVGLTGLGDLATTCFSPSSRNRTVGYELGKGRSIKDILASMDSVAEGVHTARAVHNLARKLAIDMPITEGVYKIIFKGKSARKVVSDLMGRTLKKEL